VPKLKHQLPNDLQSSGFAKSACLLCIIALGYFFTKLSVASFKREAVLLQIHKLWPAAAKASATAYPIPCEAPVITTSL
jgi:hypothetical protein